MDNKAELQANNVDLQGLIDLANELPSKLVLPTLTNPASAENIESGYEAVDGSGNLLTGSMTKVNLYSETRNIDTQSATLSIENLPFTPVGYSIIATNGLTGGSAFYTCVTGDKTANLNAPYLFLYNEAYAPSTTCSWGSNSITVTFSDNYFFYPSQTIYIRVWG